MKNDVCCSRKTSELLKDVGYPQGFSDHCYMGESLVKSVHCYDSDIAAPTIWDALEWLREEYKLFITPRLCRYTNKEQQFFWWYVADIERLPSCKISLELINSKKVVVDDEKRENQQNPVVVIELAIRESARMIEENNKIESI